MKSFQALQGSEMACLLQQRVVPREALALRVQLRRLATPPMVSHEPILFLTQRPAVKCCLALTAALELERPILSSAALGVVAHLQRHIALACLDHL